MICGILNISNCRDALARNAEFHSAVSPNYIRLDVNVTGVASRVSRDVAGGILPSVLSPVLAGLGSQRASLPRQRD